MPEGSEGARQVQTRCGSDGAPCRLAPAVKCFRGILTVTETYPALWMFVRRGVRNKPRILWRMPGILTEKTEEITRRGDTQILRDKEF
jgi:hypothetical protein